MYTCHVFGNWGITFMLVIPNVLEDSTSQFPYRFTHVHLLTTTGGKYTTPLVRQLEKSLAR